MLLVRARARARVLRGGRGEGIKDNAPRTAVSVDAPVLGQGLKAKSTVPVYATRDKQRLCSLMTAYGRQRNNSIHVYTSSTWSSIDVTHTKKAIPHPKPTPPLHPVSHQPHSKVQTTAGVVAGKWVENSACVSS